LPAGQSEIGSRKQRRVGTAAVYNTVHASEVSLWEDRAQRQDGAANREGKNNQDCRNKKWTKTQSHYFCVRLEKLSKKIKINHH
jgi:hypothetical protein